jgi:hypothetical protein
MLSRRSLRRCIDIAKLVVSRQCGQGAGAGNLELSDKTATKDLPEPHPALDAERLLLLSHAPDRPLSRPEGFVP